MRQSKKERLKSYEDH